MNPRVECRQPASAPASAKLRNCTKRRGPRAKGRGRSEEARERTGESSRPWKSESQNAHGEARDGVEGEEPEMEVKGREPVLMLDGKAANGALPEREGAKPGGADTATFFTDYIITNGRDQVKVLG